MSLGDTIGILTAFRSVGTGQCRVPTYLESTDKIYDVRSRLKDCRQLGDNVKTTNK